MLLAKPIAIIQHLIKRFAQPYLVFGSMPDVDHRLARETKAGKKFVAAGNWVLNLRPIGCHRPVHACDMAVP